jgi:hypothetical protein
MEVDREPRRPFDHVPEFPGVVGKHSDRLPDVVDVLLPGSLNAVDEHRGVHEASDLLPGSVVAGSEIGRVHLEDLAIVHVTTSIR